MIKLIAILFLTAPANAGVITSRFISFPLVGDYGTQAAPTYSFTSNPDTGIYGSSTGLAFTINNATLSYFTDAGGDPAFLPASDNTVTLGRPAQTYKDLFTKNVQIRYGELRFYDSDQSNYISFYPGATISSNFALRLPLADGSDKSALITDGAGTLTFGLPVDAQGTVCGWYDVGTATLISSCKGSDPNTSCPTGYTQRTTSTTKFCTAN